MPTTPTTYDTPDYDAFQGVLEAIEDALDAWDVSPAHRAVLASMHERAGRCVGIEPLLTPGRQAASERASELLKILRPPEPGAVREPSTIEEILARGDRALPNDPWEAVYRNERGPNGTSKLDLDLDTFSALRKAGVALIADVERLDREDRLRHLRGIGPTRLEQILGALEGS